LPIVVHVFGKTTLVRLLQLLKPTTWVILPRSDIVLIFVLLKALSPIYVRFGIAKSFIVKFVQPPKQLLLRVVILLQSISKVVNCPQLKKASLSIVVTLFNPVTVVNAPHL
jgi:hypothetical protein